MTDKVIEASWKPDDSRVWEEGSGRSAVEGRVQQREGRCIYTEVREEDTARKADLLG